MPASSDLLAMADNTYVSLVTFRKSGVPVPTAVWIARDGESLMVTTVEAAGKVKRLRNDGRVQLAPCTMGGKVAPHAVDATATVEPMTPEMERILAAKCKLAYRLTGWLDRRKKSDSSPRVILRIS